MIGSDTTTTFGAPASHIHGYFTRSKRPSTAVNHIHQCCKRPKTPSISKIKIDDFPDAVLVEILCRLHCNKLVFQCKCVSKRWGTLLSDPYFIGRFLRLQSDKQSSTLRTLINRKAEKIPPPPSRVGNNSHPSQSQRRPAPVAGQMSSHAPLSFLPLKEEPIVLATYNDLLLCCASVYYQRDYYICNPYTKQWLALPPAPQCHRKIVPVGFICDPYYQKVDKQQQISINADYRCRVVRILRPDKVVDDDGLQYHINFKFNVEIFSSETGEWREYVVLTPRGFHYDFKSTQSFAYNGMLYWGTELYNLLIGLDPFMITNSNNCTTSSSISTNGDDVIDHNYKCRFIEFDDSRNYNQFFLGCKGVYRGCLRMCHFCRTSMTLFIWDLKEQQDQMVVDGADGTLSLKHWSEYSLGKVPVYGNRSEIGLLGFDPNNEDIVYLSMADYIVMYHIRTLRWSKIKRSISDYIFLPLVLPWWPTPVPRLPLHAHGGGTSTI